MAILNCICCPHRYTAGCHQGYKPRSSRVCKMRLQATMKVAVRKLTFWSWDTAHTPANACFMILTRRALISSSSQKKLEKSCTHSK